MITLYQRTDCPFCWKVRIALAELDVEYETVETRLGEKHPEVLRLSPAGTVPVMVDGDAVIWDSAVMLDYLDGRYAPGRLLPASPAEEARVRLLHVYSDRQLGTCLRTLVFEMRSRPEREWDRELLARGREEWAACQAWLERELGGRDNFGGEFGAADCALASRCGVAEAYGVAVDAAYPGLRRWFDGAKARPSWQAAYPASFIRSG
jgi:glutathione S-transferase